MKKYIQALLAAAFLLSSLAACSGGADDAVVNESAATSAATTQTEDPYLDELPELNYNGAEVRVLYREEVGAEFYVAESDGDVVNDAVYESVTAVEDRLNLKLKATLRPGHLTPVRADYKDHITNSIMAGDDLYDWCDMMGGSAPILQQDGVFLDLLGNKYIDLTKPYYVAGIAENMSVCGKLFFITGDASLGYMKSTFCLYYNKKVADNYKIDDVYSIVDDGKWTIEKARELSLVCAADMNNDGVINVDDKLGFVIHDANLIVGLMHATGVDFFVREADGKWKFSYGAEADYNNVVNVNKLLMSGDGGYFNNGTNAIPEQLPTYNKIMGKFISDEVLFISAEMDDAVSQLRDMASDYGILPMPKANEEQENYISTGRSIHNVFCMPILAKNVDMAGAFMEALASQRHETTVPSYYEIALKTKYSRDDDSSRMYDVIHDSMYLGTGCLYKDALGVNGLFQLCTKSPDTFASTIASTTPSVAAKLEAYLQKIEDNCLG